MVNANKILTVSYGTFSCTLEGFDNSFGMMKAIAEYFRDLAADDRYFGAEPPQPDTEMLARIAEREVERRVEARLEKGGVVLRPSLVQPEPTVQDDPITTPDPRSSTPVDAAPAPIDDDAPAAPVRAPSAPMSGTDVTEKLNRIRAVVNAPAVAAYEDNDDLDETAEDQEESALAAFLEETGEQDALGLDEADADSLFVETDDAVEDDAYVSVDEDEDEDEDEAIDAIAPAVSTADTLGIAALIASQTNEIDTLDDDLGPVLQDNSLEAQDVLDEADDDALAPDFDEDTLAELDDDYAEDDTLDADDDLPQDALDDETLTEEDSPGVLLEIDTFDEDEDEDAAAFFAGGQTTSFDADDDLSDEDTSEADAIALAEDDDDAPALDLGQYARQSDEPQAIAPEAEPMRIRARVTRVKRAVFDQAVAQGQLEEVADTEDEDLSPAPLAELSTLEADEEADLARELAALRDEIEQGLAQAAPQPAIDVSPAPEDDPDLTIESVITAHLPEDDEDTLEGAALDDDAFLPDDFDDDDTFAEEPAAVSDWDDEDEDDENTPIAAPAPAPAPMAEDDDWDDDDEDDEEEARKWAEAEARIKAEEEQQRRDQEMEATIERLARKSVRKTVRMASPARALLTEGKVEDNSNSVSRLLNQTNTELDEPEGNRRRSAIAHLRAAVAATKADRILGRKQDPEEANQAYRDDLADVVRPRRPQSSGSRTERPSAQSRPAPLQLVAEQRIDEEDTAPPAPAPAQQTRPIRPRRISAAAAAVAPRRDAEGDPGFAAFAEQVGAQDITALLEAAAAYMSFVEGIDQFSRPQLMSRVSAVETEESSREDRLRSFGQLLRDGKIEKTRGGRFTASDSIAYRPEALRSAG